MQNKCGETALFAICSQGHYDLAVLLIDHGADVNYLNKVRPLHVHDQQYGVLSSGQVGLLYNYVATWSQYTSVWVIDHDVCRNSGINQEHIIYHVLLAQFRAT